MPEPKHAHFPALGLNLADGAKAMSAKQMIPDGLSHNPWSEIPGAGHSHQGRGMNGKTPAKAFRDGNVRHRKKEDKTDLKTAA